MHDVLNLLAQDSILDTTALATAEEGLSKGLALEEALRAAAPEEKWLKALATHYEIPFYPDLNAFEVPRDYYAKFPARVLLDHHLLPLRDVDGAVEIATCRLFDSAGIDELRLATGIDFRPVLVPMTEIDRAMKRLVGLGADTLQTMGEEGGIRVLETENDDLDLSKAAEDATIIRFVNQILTEALDARATDVHIEPFEHQLRVRYRVDGALTEVPVPTEVRRYHAAIVSRIKILSHLDIAEKRVPQDGAIRVKVAGRDLDLRVSVIPMVHGEAVVLRILERGDMKLGMEYLGMSTHDQTLFQKALQLPHGIVLVTGPTGSGKTTTLYAALSLINTMDLKLITVEDPVEYQMQGINQIQVNLKAGLTFATGLRAILRHDPDVVLIGEIRDKETAEIAVQASLTGHLVFSTLHTNDAPSAPTRLIDMGVEPYLIASSVELVMAQRLVRVICKQCKEEVPEAEITPMRHEFGDLVPAKLYRGRGCRACLNTGFRGRKGIFEMMALSDEIRQMVMERASSGRIRRVALEQGMVSLRNDGWRLVHEGLTTVQEVVFATKDEANIAGLAANVSAK